MSDPAHASLRFLATISETGAFKPVNAAVIRARLAMWKGRRVWVEVNREKSRRSLSQNAWLWSGIYGPISEWSGYEPEEVHELLKAMFLPVKELVLPTGETQIIPGSTAKLDSGAFSNYVDRIRRWAASQGLYLPGPGETYEVSL